ncbi:hypothetical protein Bbelb_116630 [Branchiostoma belcheri]|nr:hypothetical protein Bbelb_116630 [Branchiostoma belcheri]
MRLVTGAARSTSCEALCHWLGIHSIRDRQTILGAKEFLRIANTSSHPLHQEIVTRQDEAIPQRLITVKSWVKYSREDVEEICPVENIKSDNWVYNTQFETDRFNAEAVGSRAWRDRAGVINDTLIREFLEEKAPLLSLQPMAQSEVTQARPQKRVQNWPNTHITYRGSWSAKGVQLQQGFQSLQKPG